MTNLRSSSRVGLFTALACAPLTCVPLLGSADEAILNDAQLDAVTAGAAVDRPTGAVSVAADARGNRTHTYVNTSASATAYDAPGLPSGVGTVYVSTYGVSYAHAQGPGAFVSATADGVNAQPGVTGGPTELRWVANTRYSQIAIYNAKTVSSPVYDRHALFSHKVPNR